MTSLQPAEKEFNDMVNLTFPLKSSRKKDGYRDVRRNLAVPKKLAQTNCHQDSIRGTQVSEAKPCRRNRAIILSPENASMGKPD